MEYINVEKTVNLSVTQINDIYNNFLYLKEKFENLGFKVGEIKDSTVNYDISPADILSKFNMVEDNVRTIHQTINAFYDDSVYYKNFVWKPRTQNRKDEVWRWIDWLDMVNGIEFTSEDLVDIHGEPITDENGEQIKVYKLKE